MPSFSQFSKSRLQECHTDLQKIMNGVIKIYDITILEGHRSEQRQQELFNSGNSKVVYPNSAHNKIPSMAVDVAPHPISWSEDFSNTARYYYLAGIVKAISEELLKTNQISHKVRWGGDWDRDDLYNDQIFNDLVHFELIQLNQ